MPLDFRSFLLKVKISRCFRVFRGQTWFGGGLDLEKRRSIQRQTLIEFCSLPIFHYPIVIRALFSLETILEHQPTEAYNVLTATSLKPKLKT